MQQAELCISSNQDEVVTAAGAVAVGVVTVVFFFLEVCEVGFDFVVRIYAFLRFVCTNHRPSPPHRMSH